MSVHNRANRDRKKKIRQAKENRQKQQQEKKRKAQAENMEKLRAGQTVTTKIRVMMPSPPKYDKALSLQLVEQNINKLANLDLQAVNDAEIRSAIQDIISFKPNGVTSLIAMVSGIRQIQGPYLFRVRRCEEDCAATMKTEGDAWNPQAKYVTRKGRLNEEHESLLYVAENKETAISEMKIQEQECFWLIIYDVKAPFEVVNIGQSPQYENNLYFPVQNKIADFLRGEFTREVKQGEELQYRISRLIAHYFYSPSINNAGGWSYPSVAKKGEFCLCLDPDLIKEKLAVAYVLHGKKKNGKIQYDRLAILRENGEFKQIDLDKDVCE